ncbi:MAG: hypothetical protein GY906_24250 [bacterium]|nr:hypothetical protein [bacterium]
MPIVLDPDTRAEMQTMLDNPATSYWLRDALKSALRRDCVDAVHDAEILVTLLRKRCDAVLEQHGATLLPLSRNKPS